MIPMYRQAPFGGLLIFIFLNGFGSLAGAFLIPFVRAGIAHLGLIIFGARKGFLPTFKAMSYGGIVMLLYGMALSILQGLFYYFHPLILEPSDMTLAFWMFLLRIVVLSLVGLLHTLVVEIIAINRLQGISKPRAFLGIIFMPFILFILFFGTFMLIGMLAAI